MNPVLPVKKWEYVICEYYADEMNVCALNIAGQEGWEVGSIIWFPNIRQYQVVLKREIST